MSTLTEFNAPKIDLSPLKILLNEFLIINWISDASYKQRVQDEYFQQDKAPPHSMGDVLDLFRSHLLWQLTFNGNSCVIKRDYSNRFAKEFILYRPDLLPQFLLIDLH